MDKVDFHTKKLLMGLTKKIIFYTIYEQDIEELLNFYRTQKTFGGKCARQMQLNAHLEKLGEQIRRVVSRTERV